MDTADFLDRQMSIVEVATPAGVTSIPSSFDAWSHFTSDLQFAINDSLNISSGPFTRLPDGVRLDEVVTTTAGYDGRDSTRVALMNAVSAIAQDEMVIEVRVVGVTVVLRCGAYGLTCRP